MLLDFDPDVVGIAAQPFWLLWTTPEGKRCSHGCPRWWTAVTT